MWIERKYNRLISEAAKTRPVILLTGIRQAGKSSLLQHIFHNAEYITLDKIIYEEEAKANPTKFLERFKSQVIIDEIQYAPSLFRDLKIKVDENRKTFGNWILTGCQQFRLMQSVSESLAGRIRILNLGTLSATEIHNAGIIKNNQDLLWKGGFPEIWAENLEPEFFFDDYLQTYLERDLKQLIEVRNLYDFRRFLQLLALRTGQLMNYSEIAKDVGVSANTIKSWIGTLEISGLIVLLTPYYRNLGKRLIKAPKLYFCDNGLLCSLLNIHSQEALNNSLHQGNIWENFVFTEFIKEGFQAGKNLFYYRDQNGVEIDFIIEKDGKTRLIEAKQNERPNPRKLNFNKVVPLFKEEVNPVLACGIHEKGLFDLEEYSLYNPLFGYCL